MNLFTRIRLWLSLLKPAPPMDPLPEPPASPPTDPRTLWRTIAGIPIYRYASGMIEYTAGMAIDADGSPRAYHPISRTGLDDLRNAGGPGNWWGIVTQNGRPDGPPVIQGPDDPAPGYYVSCTTLTLPGFPRTSQRRYVDSSTIPFIVVPPVVRKKARGIILGCRAVITRAGYAPVEAVVADIGPAHKLGEASIAAAEFLGLRADPRTGGTASRIITYRIYPGERARLATAFPLIRAARSGSA